MSISLIVSVLTFSAVCLNSQGDELSRSGEEPAPCPMLTDQSVSSSAEGPSILIASPTNGAMLDGSEITVTVDVIAFRLVNKPAQGVQPGEGRLLFYVDPREGPVNPDLPAGTAQASSAQMSRHTCRNVSPGCHQFSVQLIDNDGTPMEQPKAVTVTVGVR
jgi:hypothetical protein